MRYLPAILLFGLLTTAAQAEPALQFRSRCTGLTGAANASLCRSTVSGVVSTLKDDPAYCIPKDADNRQSLTIVQDYVKAHPEEMNLTTAEVIGKAMAGAYPCAKP